MASERSNINIRNYSTASMDYDDIKADLRSFLKNQSTFKDYNFEGSGLSQIINLLAYNTHYAMVADNFAINESFLDTAVKKSSVISHANLIGYAARSARCPIAVVNVTVVFDNIEDASNAGVSIVLDKGTSFIASLDGANYVFYTDQAYSATKTDDYTFTFTDVKIYGGTSSSSQYRYAEDYQTIDLDSTNIDTTTIKVELVGDTYTQSLTKCNDITSINSESKVYFLRETPHETYVISFGNGVLGAQLETGTLIKISYISSFGPDCNGCRTFKPNFDFANSSITVKCTQAASGGAYPEEIDDIRSNAPRSFATQNRCVTVNDYKAVIKANYANIRGIAVWGGEDENPPQYGKVYISIVKNDGNYLSESEQEYIYDNILYDRKTVTSIIEFVDPTFIGININSVVYYDSTNTSGNSETIKTTVTNTIKKYCENHLGGFDDRLKYSRLIAAIDNSDLAISNNNTSIILTYDFTASINSNVTYVANFNNEIHQSVYPSSDVQSSGFYCNETSNICYLDDDPATNTLRLFYYDSNNEKVVIRNLGTVSYATGTITIDHINITAVPNINNTIRIMIKPEYNDVVSKHNQYAILNSVIVSAIAEE